MDSQATVFIHLCLPHILEVSTGVGHMQGVGLYRVWLLGGGQGSWSQVTILLTTASPSNTELRLHNNAAAAAKSLQSCPTLRPHGLQPTRLLCPKDSPGKNTGAGCHFLVRAQECTHSKFLDPLADRGLLTVPPLKIKINTTLLPNAPASLVRGREAWHAAAHGVAKVQI